MTDESVRKNLGDELRLAQSALTAARALLDVDCAPDAASRIYYAAFHAARALLFSLGLEPRSHQAVRNLLGHHFVKTGLLATTHAKSLMALEGLRSAGDYDSSFALRPDDLRPELARAQALVDAARALLGSQGFLS